MPGQKDVAMRKRQQIDSSKKTMFIVVATVAFVVGVSAVVSFLLVQQILFHGKIIGEKDTTIKTLSDNIKNIEELKKHIRALETNSRLNALKTNQQANGLQPVLDALPTDRNADALGASLQNNFIGAVSGLVLESLSIDTSSDEGGDDSTLTFSLTVAGTPDQLKELLLRFERSIRVIDILSAELQANEQNLSLVIRGRAHYQKTQPVEMQEKVVKP